MIKQFVRWIAVAALSLASAGLALAQTAPDCQEDTCRRHPTGEWKSNRADVVQIANVSTSSNGVTVSTTISGRSQGIQGSPGQPGGVIREQPRSGQQYGGPGFSVPERSTAGTQPILGGSAPGTPSILLPGDGSNVIVPGGPMSFDISPGQPPTMFGGYSVGGWTMDTPLTGGLTTPFAPVGPVPHINAWSLALQAEQEFPLPSITLKVNPDPGRVNVDSWFWVVGYDGSVITHSKTQHASHTECRLLEGAVDCHEVDDSVTVVVRLTPKHYAWTFGDDRNNTAGFNDSKGLGRAYTDPDPRDASPVAHAYHWSSINFLNQGGYPITLTIDWSAEFSANGGGFQGIPAVTHTYAGHHQVRQIQSIVSR